MSDPYTTSTSQSYFQRLGSSFGGIIGGFLLIIVACGVLWWNEGRAVTAEKGLEAAGSAAISLASTTPDAANDTKLIHATGEARAVAPLEDADLGVSFPNTLTVSRTVEMYQWKEESSTKTEERIGGGQTTTTTYSYKKEWSSSEIDSSKFNPSASAAETRKQHQRLINPPMTLKSREFAANDATLGGFKLKGDLLSQLGDAQPTKPEKAPEGWTASADGFYKGTTTGVATTTTDPVTGATTTTGTSTSTEGAPEIGDLRVKYASVASPMTVSVLARQSGANLEKWRAPNGYEIYRLSAGDKTAEMMIADQQSAENMMTWILRGVGTLMNCIGFALILSPLKAIANVLPFVANIIGAGIGIIGFALGVPLSLIVIALAWLVYRPIVGAALLAAAIGIIYYFGWVRKRKAPVIAAPAPT